MVLTVVVDTMVILVKKFDFVIRRTNPFWQNDVTETKHLSFLFYLIFKNVLTKRTDNFFFFFTPGFSKSTLNSEKFLYSKLSYNYT